tara:strand:- start:2107 stop:2211 length:105 start_codon:yes stop_codon:yes gene_type:complete
MTDVNVFIGYNVFMDNNEYFKYLSFMDDIETVIE